MWETAERAGIRTAHLMWSVWTDFTNGRILSLINIPLRRPGPPKTSSGASSTYFVPWADKVPLKEKHDQLMSWIDLPFNERPQLLMGEF